MDEFEKKIREIEHMHEVFPTEILKLQRAVCRRLKQDDLDYTCCEDDGAFVFTVYYEDSCEDCCDVTFGITPDGDLRVVGKEWELAAGQAGSMMFFLADIYENASLRRSDPFDDDTSIFMAYGAQIDMLLQTPELAAEFCLRAAEHVASVSYDADQTIFELTHANQTEQDED